MPSLPLALIAILAAALPAGEVPPDASLGFTEVVGRALLANPRYRRDAIAWETALDSSRLAGLGFTLRPTLSLSATQAEGDVRDEFARAGISLRTVGLGDFSVDSTLAHCKYMPLGASCADPDNYGTSLTLTWTYDLAQGQNLRIRGAPLTRSAWDLEVAHIALFRARQEAVAQAIQRFLSLRRTDRQLEIQEQSVFDNERSLRNAQILFDLKVRPGREVSQASLQLAEANLSRLDAAASLTSSWENLNRFLDQPLDTRFDLDTALLPVPAELPDLEAAVAGRNSLDTAVEAAISIGRAKLSLLELRDSLRWPVFLSLTGGGFGEGRTADEAIFQGSHRDAAASLTVQVPLDRRDASIRRDNAERALDRTRISFEETHADLERDLRAAHREIARSAAALEISHTRLTQAGENFRMQEISYQQGLADLDALQIAQRGLVNAQTGLAAAEDALASAWIAWWRGTDADLAALFAPEEKG
ncbi:TolC family protein [bacterium]|nr:TolC family protein [bacterium]